MNLHATVHERDTKGQRDLSRRGEAIKTKNLFLVCSYLVAIILANLSVATFGPASTIINAFLFIGLDLTSRDKLHEAWHKKHLALKMFTLISAGAVLSWLLDRNAGQVAIASFIAFAAAASADALVYQMLYKRSWRVKVNGSNLVSAAVDSILFPTIAFGGLLPLVTIGQFAAKVFGGFVWSIILGKREQ